MAIEVPILPFSFTATADLSGKQFYCVDLDATNATSNLANVVVASVAGQKVLGVLQNKPIAGQTANVMLYGITKAIAGGTVTQGDLVTTDANGKVVTAATGNFILGRALESAAAGGVFSVLLLPGGKD